jgi:predicted PurR-regulated permease PerM
MYSGEHHLEFREVCMAEKGRSGVVREESEARVEGEPGLYGSTGSSGQIFRKTLLQATTILVIVMLALLARETVYILLLFFAGILLAVLLDFFGRQIMRLPRVPHWLAVTFVLILLTGLLVLVFILVVPMVAEETEALAAQIHKSIEELMEWLQQNAGGRYLVEQLSRMNMQAGDGEMWGRVAGIFSTTLGAITGLSIIVIVGVFLAYSPGMYQTGFLHLVPIVHRERAAEVMTSIGTTLRWWLLGQLISMTVLAVSTWIMLTLLDVPLALILALITGLMTFIPYLGPLIALIPIILLSFLESPFLALNVFILYMGIQNVEANVLMPIIFHRTVHIPPALGVISQILFGSLLGVLGFILAIPLMAVILQFLKMIYVEDVLGDRSVANN